MGREELLGRRGAACTDRHLRRSTGHQAGVRLNVAGTEGRPVRKPLPRPYQRQSSARRRGVGGVYQRRNLNAPVLLLVQLAGDVQALSAWQPAIVSQPDRERLARPDRLASLARVLKRGERSIKTRPEWVDVKPGPKKLNSATANGEGTPNFSKYRLTQIFDGFGLRRAVRAGLDVLKVVRAEKRGAEGSRALTALSGAGAERWRGEGCGEAQGPAIKCSSCR